jgi:predicted enzyme related to lactoylglutathione lyase
MKPGTTKLYFATSDVAAARKELSDKGVKVNEVKDDLFGPGSGVKWFNFEDPDGNEVLLVQA